MTDGLTTNPGDPPRRVLFRPLVQVVLLLAVCLVIYWPMLGKAGFSGTEGHRAIPAYHMLDSGDWLVPHLFGRPYLRKPPGMPWAIAGASVLFGETEFAARSVSALAATLSSLVALGFGRRWFGPAGGLYAGLCQALMPIFWSSARSADIESLMLLGVQVAALAAVDLVVSPRPTRSTGLMALLMACGIALAGLTKGPSGATAFLSTLAAVAFAARSPRPLLHPSLLAGLAAGLAPVALIFWMIAHRAAGAPAPPVTQAVDEFLWQQGKTAQVLLLAPSALVMALPGSLALLFPWGPDAKAEHHLPPALPFPRALPIARILTIAVVLSLAVLTVAGISNPRYAMPTQMLIAPVAGYFGLGLTGLFILKRPPIARAFLLGHPLIMAGGLLVASLVLLSTAEARRTRVAGTEAGELIAHAVPAGATIWADHLIEARPDVLWYAARAAPGLKIEWKPLAAAPLLPPDGVFLVLRDDEDAGDYRKYADAGLLASLREVSRGSVYQYSFRVLARSENAPR